ncbi:sulfur carrier protein ThiS [Undibacterium jejuense]|uniref:Sulfur carrier protein ThiS n=1 Tax=Undibacterium jejuense TaxID=1344949 RepID=A0A923HFX2_9BURK|nr:sulfur carrier protein ThiS [Undibacterium jejuense]MBC3861335.1 sulfur carrier protein ThiS [Undibacterium jejuense]
MDIELNGSPYLLTEGNTVNDLIAILDLSQKNIAVAVNRQIIPRHEWISQSLRINDKVDIVRAIGGG